MSLAGWLMSWVMACTLSVRASGVIEATPESVRIAAANGKSRPIVIEGPGAALRHADGLMVDLEGVTERGSIRVERFRVVEGPNGLSAWVGTLRQRPEGLVLVEAFGGPTLRLTGRMTDTLFDHVDEVVLIEAIIDGPMSVQVMSWRPLHDDAP